MTDLIQNVISKLVNDSTLAGLMKTTIPIKNLYTGPTDVVKETQVQLGFPLISIYAVAESFRTVPQGARDSRISIEIWSRNSEKEVQDIYERICVLLNFKQNDKNSTWVAWERGSGLSSSYETEARLWHWVFDITVWSI